MHSSVQEGVKYLFQKSTWSNKSLQNADSTDFSTKSAPDSLESGPHEKKKGSSSSIKILAKDVVNVFGGCFVQSKREKQDDELSFKDISVTSTSTNTSLLQSSGSSNSAAYSFNEGLKEGSEIVTFTMNELVRATGNFSPSLKIGQGGFGTVYRGKLSNGRLVAVKRAKKNASDKQLSAEFQNELATLASVEHLNLVKFIGYLEEHNERILVVEYVSNGNLREHLDGLYGVVLDLATRLDIIIDVAHALTYLHLYADRSIIHRDIKSSNILLTENFRAKVADFGFSRLAPWEVDATHVSTQVKGTAGYLDPEYLKTYQLTQKSDVYSFGVLLVEIITGRRPIEQKREVKERITTRWAFQMFLDGKAIEILDSKLEKTSAAYLMVEKLLELAFQCAAPTRKERPSMKKTVELLWNIRKDYREVLQEQPPQQPL